MKAILKKPNAFSLMPIASPNAKFGIKLSGYTDYYRIRIGEYRIGLKYSNKTITLVRFLHRKDIYKFFP